MVIQKRVLSWLSVGSRLVCFVVGASANLNNGVEIDRWQADNGGNFVAKFDDNIPAGRDGRLQQQVRVTSVIYPSGSLNAEAPD